MHRGRFGKADRAPHEPLDSGPQIDVFTLNSLRVEGIQKFLALT
jgi:hypothetical protein